MKDKEQLDEMRRRIQEAISQAKRDELRDKFGMQVESYFCLRPNPYTGWDVVQTSLLDDLQQSLKM